ncbi:MAG: hypothetical protein V3U65_16995 [Granulosicoccaceae bacterium]
MTLKMQLLPLLAMAAISTAASAEWDIRGNVTGQAQYFTENANHTGDHKSNVSLSSEIELYQSLTDSTSITVTPFFRIDQQDEERTHFDFREFLFHQVRENWEWKIGLGKVFWGVAESVNLIDVINQRDSVENGDSSEKLGQAMINVFTSREWGDVEFYILPGFRERSFPGEDGRPRPSLVIDTNDARFESDDKEHHIDFAFRVSKTLGDWDVGLHAFTGTARTPELVFNTNTGKLIPFYYQKNQVGIDAQATFESWLLKAEIIGITADRIENHAELVTGFEYSFYGIAESDIDLGVVAEWLYDDRKNNNVPSTNPFQNDLLIGLRFALNDEQSSDALLGVITDLDGDGEILSLEANRRIGSKVKASLDMRYWVNQPENSQFANEDYLQLELAYFF